MTKLYFIRHGKTQWNLQGRYQGANGDSPLLKESYQEINQLVGYLNKIKFEKIYTSPIQRASTTAKQIATELGQKINLEKIDEFKEFDLGKMEGMKFVDVKKKYPKEYDSFRNHPESYDPSVIRGESFEDVFKRFSPKINEICKIYPKGNVLIVSHGAVMCAAIRHLLGYKLKDIRKSGGLNNTSTTILETSDGKVFSCLKWNDVSYLTRKLDQSDIV